MNNKQIITAEVCHGVRQQSLIFNMQSILNNPFKRFSVIIGLLIPGKEARTFAIKRGNLLRKTNGAIACVFNLFLFCFKPFFSFHLSFPFRGVNEKQSRCRKPIYRTSKFKLFSLLTTQFVAAWAQLQYQLDIPRFPRDDIVEIITFTSQSPLVCAKLIHKLFEMHDVS